MRKVKKADIQKFQEQTGVSVKLNESPNQDKKHEFNLTVPEDMLSPLIEIMTQFVNGQERVQSMMAAALSKLALDTNISMQVTERDQDGNIKNLSIQRPTRH